MIELSVLAFRYFCLVLRFFIFFNKTKMSLSEIKKSRGIVLNDFNYSIKKSVETYNRLTFDEMKFDA